MLRDLLTRTESDEAQGQVVIVAARWILAVAGLMLALWAPQELVELRVQIVMVLGLAVANFFLHSRLLAKRPIPTPIAYMASAVDILVISLIIIVGGGFSSGIYVFYFPALLAISVAFQPNTSLVFGAVTLATYGLISIGTGGAEDGATLVTRLVMLGAVVACGNVYWRQERDRRAGKRFGQGSPRLLDNLGSPENGRDKTAERFGQGSPRSRVR